ncbi:hypothetical protein CR513_48209, partial [Mucuna pruriens]
MHWQCRKQSAHTSKKSATNMSIFVSDQSDSSSSCLARSFKNYNKMGTHVMHPSWSMSSLMTALPESPSTLCSHASTTRHSHYSHTTNYSHQLFLFWVLQNVCNVLFFMSLIRIFLIYHIWFLESQSFGTACNSDNHDNNLSTCLSDIDEWLEHANKFCKSSNHLTESVHSGQNGSREEEEDSRLSAICNTYLGASEHELYNITLPCVREESPTCTYRTRKCGGYECTRLMRPYDEFLDDVRRRKHEAERNARKKAKHVELTLRMRRKENAINDWELKQTRKAMDKMDKIQAYQTTSLLDRVHQPSNANELERKQFRASARTQKKICLVREKAEKQKLNLRRSTLKRFQQMQTSETHSAPSEISWGSRLPL